MYKCYYFNLQKKKLKNLLLTILYILGKKFIALEYENKLMDIKNEAEEPIIITSV